jgi:predicted nucleic acid-binding protein
VIYLDTSVALAHLFREPAAPPDEFWNESLVSSELLEYELCVRTNARGLPLEPVHSLLSRVAIIPLQASVLKRALAPFPTAVRTLDALHLASLDHLRSHRQALQLASFDRRMCEAAVALGFPLHPVCGS